MMMMLLIVLFQKQTWYTFGKGTAGISRCNGGERHKQNMELMRERGVGALFRVYHVTSMAEVCEALSAIIMQRATLAETNEAE